MSRGEGVAIEIVPIAVEHVEGFREALDLVARERRYILTLEAPPLENIRAFVLRNIANDHAQFVALAAGKVLGWCDVLPKERESQFHCGNLGMAVLADFRGLGIGTRLLAATLQKAWARGLVRVELGAYADNLRAIALYEKLGFKREGVARATVKIDGRYLDEVRMAIVDKAKIAAERVQR